MANRGGTSVALAPVRAGDPTRLGPWHVRGRLGEGGMGVVYLGEHRGRLAAVKTVHPQLADDVAFRRRFKREADAVDAIRSPRIAQFLGADMAGSTAWLASEYVDGPTLHQWVQQHGVFVDDSLIAFSAALADAITTIHLAGVTHRDVKPSNVICTRSGPVVIDFGVAAIAESTSLTATGTTVGSVGWMAPEQAAGRRIGPECDTFSWAATVCFAASGEPPFGFGRPEAVIYRILSEEPAVPPMPLVLDRLVHDALNKEPGARPTAATIRETLAPALDEDPSQTVTGLLSATWVWPLEQIVAGEPHVRRRPRSRRLVFAAGVIAALSIALLVAQTIDEPPTQSAAEQRIGTVAPEVQPTSTTTASTTLTTVRPSTATSLPAPSVVGLAPPGFVAAGHPDGRFGVDLARVGGDLDAFYETFGPPSETGVAEMCCGYAYAWRLDGGTSIAVETTEDGMITWISVNVPIRGDPVALAHGVAIGSSSYRDVLAAWGEDEPGDPGAYFGCADDYGIFAVVQQDRDGGGIQDESAPLRFFKTGYADAGPHETGC